MRQYGQFLAIKTDIRPEKYNTVSYRRELNEDRDNNWIHEILVIYDSLSKSVKSGQIETRCTTQYWAAIRDPDFGDSATAGSCKADRTFSCLHASAVYLKWWWNWDVNEAILTCNCGGDCSPWN